MMTLFVRFVLMVAFVVSGPVAAVTLSTEFWDKTSTIGLAVFDDAGGSISVKMNWTGTVNAGTYTLDLYPLPLRLDVNGSPCQAQYLGTKVRTLASLTKANVDQRAAVTVTSQPPVALSGANSMAGKTLMVTFPGGNKYCSLIGNTRKMKTAYARFPYVIGGEITFRQEATGGHVTVYSNLFDLLGNHDGKDANWIITMGKISDDVTKRCKSLPSGGTPISSAPVGQTSGTKLSAKTVTLITVTGPDSIIGKVVVLKAGSGDVLACAHIVELKPKSAEAVFSNDGLRGKILFKQDSPFDWTRVMINVRGIGSASAWGVREYPMFPKLRKQDDACIDALVGGYFNPLSNVNPAVGELSKKFAALSGLATGGNIMNKAFFGEQLPLFGRYSIIGRSLLIEMTNKQICTNILPPEEVVTGVATFTYPVIGRIIIQQLANRPQSDTSIYIEMKYPDGQNVTSNHNWHVHVKQITSDFLASRGRCGDCKGHYNPYMMNISSPQYQKCNPGNPLQCELGDSAKKHLKINLGKNTGFSRYVFTDIDLPLSGPYSVLGRSFVIHGASAAASRYACANIYHQRTLMAVTKPWNERPWIGPISFKQPSVFNPVEISVHLNSLQSLAGGYHVHVFPVPQGISTPCSNAAVSGHFNPFNLTTWPAATVGTDDQYEKGDLSNKFGLLTGLSSKQAVYTDTNLDLTGQQSIVGRSLVIHKSSTGAPRWICANITYSNQDGTYFHARANFDGEEDLVGYVRLSQMVWPDGSSTDTAIEVEMYYRANKTRVTTGHNWHIGVGYNPFEVDSHFQARYATECSFTNPLACALSDTSGKQKPYDVGQGKAFFTDVYTPLFGNFSVIGRPIVFYAANRGAACLASADIIPETKITTKMVFQWYDFHNKQTLKVILVHALKTPAQYFAIAKMVTPQDIGCQYAIVAFTGFKAEKLKSGLEEMMKRRDCILGTYVETKECKTLSTSSGPTLAASPMTFVTLIISIIYKWNQV